MRSACQESNEKVLRGWPAFDRSEQGSEPHLRAQPFPDRPYRDSSSCSGSRPVRKAGDEPATTDLGERGSARRRQRVRRQRLLRCPACSKAERQISTQPGRWPTPQQTRSRRSEGLQWVVSGHGGDVRFYRLLPESRPAENHPTRSSNGRAGPDPTSPLSMSCPEPKSGHDSRARRAWLADRDKSSSISMRMSLIRRRPSRDRPLGRRWLERGPLETSGPRGESTAFPVTLIGQPLGCRKS